MRPRAGISVAIFPYAVVFMEKPEHIWIVAVMHMKRRPGYWRERLV